MVKRFSYFIHNILKATIFLLAFLCFVSTANGQPGTVDRDFGSNGFTITPFLAGKSSDFSDIALQTDGKIVTAGEIRGADNMDFGIARFKTDGTLDPGFGSGGKVITDFRGGDDKARAVAVLPNGKIIVVGQVWNGSNLDMGIARYNSNGTLDTGFGPARDGKVLTDFDGGEDWARAVVILPNGKIVVGGEAQIAGNTDFAVVRYNSDGTLDTSFGPDRNGKAVTDFGGARDEGKSMLIQPDGYIVLAGSIGEGAVADFGIARFNSNGILDTGFDGDGKVTTDFHSREDLGISIAVQQDKKLILAGRARNSSDRWEVGVVRYNSNGTLDTGFDGDGKLLIDFLGGDDYGRSVVVQPDGKIIISGEAYLRGVADIALIRLQTNGTPDNSFGTRGDGKVITEDLGGSAEAINAAEIKNGKLYVAGRTGSTSIAFVGAYHLYELGKLSISKVQDAAEDDKDGYFELKATKALPADAVISFELSPGTATEGTDYETVSRQVTLRAGQLTTRIEIKVKEDAVVEGDEEVSLELTEIVGEGLKLDEEKKTGTLKILDNDKAVLSVINKKDAAEPDVDGAFTIAASNELDEDLTISFELSTGTAREGEDYEAVTRQVLLKKGSKQAEVLIKVINNPEVEDEETVTLTLVAPTTPGVELDSDQAKQKAIVKITDDDVKPAVVLSISKTHDAAEPDQDGRFLISATVAPEEDLLISFTLSGTAVAADYSTLQNFEVVLEKGNPLRAVHINVIDDQLDEPDETVIITLNEPTKDGIELDNAKKTATLTIKDNDEPPVAVVLSVAKGKDAAEPAENGHFIISATVAPEEDLVISFVLDATATAKEGDDYEIIGQQVTLRAGQKTVQVPVQVRNDEDIEGDETVSLTLQAPTKAGVSLDPDRNKQKATLTIKDDEEEPNDVLLSVAKSKDAAEDETNGEFIISTSATLSTDLTIGYTLTGTAIPGDDYTAPGNQVVLTAGQTSVKVVIAVKKDAEVEQEETVILTLNTPTTAGVVLDDAKKSATIKITDNDTEVEDILLSVAKVKDAAEPDQHGQFLISATVAPREDLPINFSLTGTAKEGTDYKPVGQQVILEKGKTSVAVQITVENNAEVEQDETVIITLAVPTKEGVKLNESKKTATLTILEDDEDPPVPVIVLSVAKGKDAAEPDQHGHFLISATSAPVEDLTISFVLDASATAKEGTDYDAVGQQVTLKAGQKTVQVQIKVKDDQLVEQEETVVLTLQAPSKEGVALDANGNKQKATLTIKDDEKAPVPPVVLSVVKGKDAAEPAENGHFIISATVPPEEDLSISFKLAGTALATDYSTTLAKEEVVLKAGQKTVQVPVQVINDAEVEPDETVVLSLNTPTKAGVELDNAKQSATLIIKDDDKPPVAVVLSVAKSKEAQEDTENGTFEISASGPLPEDLSISYTLTGTALAGVDYTSPGNQVVLSAGQTSVQVVIAVIADADVEQEEIVTLTLKAPTLAGVVLDPDQNKQKATIKITDNDEEVAPASALLPNLFSPNGDQVNDNFLLHAINIKAMHLQVFNRQGRLVYETKSLEDATIMGWDGNFNGATVPEDTYVWILNYQDMSPRPAHVKLKGSVTLIR